MYKVFIVDDEPIIIEGLRQIIDWNDYELEIIGHATNGVTALSSLSAENVDILITDIKMPQMDGLSLISEVKKKNPRTKFIVLSGYNEFDFVKKGIVLGIENYLLKPINVEELKSTLRNTIEKIRSAIYMELNNNENFNILKNNILYRWITGSIDHIELKNRTDLLHINIECSFYAVCIIESANNIDSSADFLENLPFSAIYNTIYSLTSQKDFYVCFDNLNRSFILIYGSDTQDSAVEYLNSKLCQIIQDLSAINNFDAYITVGEFQKGFANVYKSYVQAEKMQEYRLLNTTNSKIYFYSKDYNSEEKVNFKIDYKLFSKLLFSKNREEIFIFIDLVFNSLQNCPNLTPSYIHNCCIEMIIHINRTVQNFEYTNYLKENDYKEMFTSLINLRTFDQLKNLIHEIADNAVNCLISDNDHLSPIIRHVMNHISENYADELSLKTLGYKLNINPVYLGQLFQKEIGRPFNEYINQFRMEKAKQLLLNTNLTATEISKKVGVNDSNYFFRLFKKNMGVSPSDLRRSIS